MYKKIIITLLLILHCHLIMVINHELSHTISSQITNGCKMVWKVPVAGVCGIGQATVDGCTKVYQNVPISSLCHMNNLATGGVLGAAAGGLYAHINYVKDKNIIDSSMTCAILNSIVSVGFVIEGAKTGAVFGATASGFYQMGSEFTSGAHAGLYKGCNQACDCLDSIDLQKQFNCSPEEEAATWVIGTVTMAGLTYYLVEFCKTVPEIKC